MNARASRQDPGPSTAARLLVTAILAVAGAAACDRAEPAAPAAAESASAYLPPPRVTEVTGSGAELVIRGRARPGERVRLLDAGGSAYGATADGQGAFSVSVPVSGAGLFGVTAQRAGRVQPAEGWLYVPPGAPELALVLRPGAPAGLLGRAPRLAAVEYDAGGGVALGGRVEPEAQVRVLLDGAIVGETRADDSGRYALRLAAAVPPGPHDIQVNAGGVRVERRLDLSVTPPQGVAQTAPFEGGWRVAWRPPGGGVQVTYVLAATWD